MSGHSTQYHKPEALVSTEWLAEHLSDPNLCIIASNEDPLVYHSGHIPGAYEVDWMRDLNDPVRRDFIDRAAFQHLMRSIGADENSTIVIYGDKNNWWACYAYWVFQLYGLKNLKILNGGRLKWMMEKRPLVRDIPAPGDSSYVAPERHDNASRAFRKDMISHYDQGKTILDVRSPEEYRGESLHMPGYLSDGALRAGRIPGSVHIHWEHSFDKDAGTFRAYNQLLDTYTTEGGLKEDDEIIIYCRIGKRSSHTWFVLTQLLGFTRVLNYTGGWLEWGNLEGAPIER